MEELEDYVDARKSPRRRGRVAAAITQRGPTTSEETRIIMALIQLRRGMSPARVAIQPQIDLPIEMVKRLAAALHAVSTT